MTYVLDTNIITAILKGNEKVKKMAQKSKLEGKKVFINGISYYEIKRGLLATNATAQLKRFEMLCREFDLVLLDTHDIFDRAAEIYADLRRRGELLEDADILIASIVIFRNFILVSNDTDFNRIHGLKIENWLN
ncbi:MAG: VapC toxin family PIN domain ribonuclease [Candidatus Altiarchaeales archaeon HGW-Altiarchaeales-1]|nr:MAG: VapC toxin family PIN domain ribonuclease [Candidatus Altiarchaeales archaeon HGW-Altiarchaeales-1]